MSPPTKPAPSLLRVVLADDEPLALMRLEGILADIPGIALAGVAHDGDEAAAQIAALKPDLVLLDIRMPGQSGLSLASALRDDPDIDVIFTTAFDQFALQAFELDAVDYLLKPVEPQRLSIAIDRVRRRRRQSGEPPIPERPEDDVSVIWVPYRDGSVRVDLASVDWIEAARDYALLHTPTRSHMLRATLDSLLEHAGPDNMVRVSRSAIVRPAAVVRIGRDGRNSFVLELYDGTAIRVGVTYAESVRARFPVGARPEQG
ncbi:MAG: response regulator transcription factor [Sphingomonadales bacterium]|nr:MAG: response regulator transcription factor [Sphingomonadales bacterium]